MDILTIVGVPFIIGVPFIVGVPLSLPLSNVMVTKLGNSNTFWTVVVLEKNKTLATNVFLCKLYVSLWVNDFLFGELLLSKHINNND